MISSFMVEAPLCAQSAVTGLNVKYVLRIRGLSRDDSELTLLGLRGRERRREKQTDGPTESEVSDWSEGPSGFDSPPGNSCQSSSVI